MPISCHFRDCKAFLVAMTRVRSAIASTGPLPFLILTIVLCCGDFALQCSRCCYAELAVVVRLLCVSAAHVEMVLAATDWQVWATENHWITPHYSGITDLCCWSVFHYLFFFFYPILFKCQELYNIVRVCYAMKTVCCKIAPLFQLTCFNCCF